MRSLVKYQKKISLLLILVMCIQFITPNICYALTSGPSQPEMKGFEAIGNSDMVDLFSGDFSYNIPLIDVGGYPVNLAYHSGSSMDDEASWVGYGWGLNVGSVNRQLRGIPDDFNGTDLQQREMNIKDHITKGGKFSATLDFLGMPALKIKGTKKKKKLSFTAPTISIGVKVDNYRGIGMELGANTGLSLSEYVAGDKTGKQPDSLELNSISNLGTIGLNLSSMDGASLNLNADILKKKTRFDDRFVSKSIGFSYNTRAGLTGMTLTNSVKQAQYDDNDVKTFKTIVENPSSFISFNGEAFAP